MINIPIDLKNAICNKKLIVFVGAGLSYNLLNTNNQPIKGWANLVENILIHLKEEEYDVEHFFPLLKKYDPIIILDLMEKDKSIPKSKINSFIKKFLELDDEKNNYAIHRDICSISNKVITTNYDTAFERAVPLLRTAKAYSGKNYELTLHKETKAKLLFKLHGCYEDSDSMVLFPTDYEALYNTAERDPEHSLLVLKNIIHNNTLLFIGAGMGDFQINNIFKEVERLQGQYNQKHYIITNKDLDSSLDFLVPLRIKDYSEIGGVVKRIIDIQRESLEEDSSEVKKLKEELAITKKRLRELEEKGDSSKDILLEREALKYFSRGLEFNLEGKHGEAIREYDTCVELKSDLHQAFYNWGTSLGYLAESKDGIEKEQYLNLAFKKYQKASQLGGDSYNLACWYATHKKETEAFRALRKSLRNNDVPVDFVLQDEDWKEYRQHEEFKDIINEFWAKESEK